MWSPVSHGEVGDRVKNIFRAILFVLVGIPILAVLFSQMGVWYLCPILVGGGFFIVMIYNERQKYEVRRAKQWAWENAHTVYKAPDEPPMYPQWDFSAPGTFELPRREDDIKDLDA